MLLLIIYNFNVTMHNTLILYLLYIMYQIIISSVFKLIAKIEIKAINILDYIKNRKI